MLSADNSGDAVASSGKTDRYKGMGVGLRSVRAVVEKHGGSLDFRKEDGVYKTSVILLAVRDAS